MGLHVLTAQAAIDHWPLKAPLVNASIGPYAIDARSESEYAHDHLPFAHNWPVLNDAQRTQVGTLYKQVHPFEANKLGAALVSDNISKHLHQHVQAYGRNWRPLVYCWRGGNRSGALAYVLGKIGFHVQLIEGGYKALRASLLADLTQRVSQLKFVVLDGATGSGKTRLLQQLKVLGAQVLDLEDLACHRSSVLGHWPDQPQPSQKHFDMRIWQVVRGLDSNQPVFVEAESKRVGAVTIHANLFEHMQHADVVSLQVPMATRVECLCEDYQHFIDNPALFEARLGALEGIVGRKIIDTWLQLCRQGLWTDMVEDLLNRHYDPNYRKATLRLYAQAKSNLPVALSSLRPEALRQTAIWLMQTWR